MIVRDATVDDLPPVRDISNALIDRAWASDVHIMVGAIDSAIRYHEGVGFSTVARMPEVGTKFGRWLDLVLMQRILTDGSLRRT